MAAAAAAVLSCAFALVVVAGVVVAVPAVVVAVGVGVALDGLESNLRREGFAGLTFSTPRYLAKDSRHSSSPVSVTP